MYPFDPISPALFCRQMRLAAIPGIAGNRHLVMVRDEIVHFILDLMLKRPAGVFDMGPHMLGQGVEHLRIAQAQRGIFLHHLPDPFLLGIQQAGQIAAIMDFGESVIRIFQLHMGQAPGFVLGEARHLGEQGAILVQRLFQGVAQLRDILVRGMSVSVILVVHGNLLC